VTQGPRPTLRVATYNIHRCRGLERRTRPERTAAVLRAIDADVVALQEVVGPGPHDGGPLRRSARCSGWDGSWRRRGSFAAISSVTPC